MLNRMEVFQNGVLEEYLDKEGESNMSMDETV
jgi:hypothetical protein